LSPGANQRRGGAMPQSVQAYVSQTSTPNPPYRPEAWQQRRL
jgi:hypothetical protein